MLADTVEYGEWKFGRRSESITFSVQTFVVKLAMGLSAGVAGLGLTIFGFKGDRNVDSETFVYETQSMFTLWGIRSLMFILPIIGLLIALYIFRKYHILDEKKFSEVVHELRVRKGEENA
jgi:melibiose permease